VTAPALIGHDLMPPSGPVGATNPQHLPRPVLVQGVGYSCPKGGNSSRTQRLGTERDGRLPRRSVSHTGLGRRCRGATVQGGARDVHALFAGPELSVLCREAG
jgi:hypothetical protein